MSEHTEAGTKFVYTLRDLTYVVFRHKRKVGLFVLVVVALVTVMTLVEPPRYQSQAKLLIRPSRTPAAPGPLDGPVVKSSWENEINTELEIILSATLRRMVVEKIGLEAWSSDERKDEGAAPAGGGTGSESDGWLADLGSEDAPKSEWEAVSRLKEGLNADNISATNIIQITYEDYSPRAAQRVVAALVDCYLKRRIQVNSSPATLNLLEDKLKEVEDKIATKQEALAALKLETKIADLAADRQALINQIGTLKKEIDTTTANLAETREYIKVLGEELSQLTMQSESGWVEAPSEIHTALLIKLNDLMVQEGGALEQFREDSKEVRAIRRQIDEVNKLLKQEEPTRKSVTTSIDRAYSELRLNQITARADLGRLGGKLVGLNGGLAKAEENLRKLTAKEQDIQNLTDELLLLQGDKEQFRSHFQQAFIDKEAESRAISNIGIVEPATYEGLPVSPQVALNIVLGLFLGLLGGLGIAFLAEYLDHSLNRPADVERRLHLPTLVSIPRLSRWKSMVPVKTEVAAGDQTESEVGDDAAGRDGVQWEIPSHLIEPFERIRTRLILSVNGTGESRSPVVGVTSCCAGEGASTVAANLAAMFARGFGNRVGFVDATGRRENVKRLFELDHIDEAAGIRVDESTGEIAITPSRAGNIDFILNLADFDGSRYVGAILNRLREQYGLVVIDAPPVLGANSGVRWTRLADDVIFVVEAGGVRWEVAQEAKELLRETAANVMGVVLNKRTYPVPRWLYGVV